MSSVNEGLWAQFFVSRIPSINLKRNYVSNSNSMKQDKSVYTGQIKVKNIYVNIQGKGDTYVIKLYCVQNTNDGSTM